MSWNVALLLVAVAILATLAIAKPGIGSATIAFASGLAAPASPAVGSSEPGAQAASPNAPTFVVRGLGATTKSVDLYSAPGGGVVVGTLSPGAPVAAGGLVMVRAGFTRRAMAWVRVEGSPSPAYGFIPADSVALAGLTPPILDLDGVPLALLTSPVDGVTTTPASANRPAEDGTPALASPETASSTAVSAMSASPTNLGIAIPWLPPTVGHWTTLLAEAAARHGVDAELLAIVMLVESGGNPQAQSGSGALGLMQVMPTTAAGIAGSRGIQGFAVSQMSDPATNIDFGAWYLAQQLKAYGQTDDPDWQTSVTLAAAAYNGGPGSVKRHLAGAALPAETERYRAWVGGMWRERHAATSETFQRWMEAGGSRLVAAAEVSQTTAQR